MDSHLLGKRPCKGKLKNSTQNTYCCFNPLKITDKKNQTLIAQMVVQSGAAKSSKLHKLYTRSGAGKSLSTLSIQCQVQLQNQRKPKWEKSVIKSKFNRTNRNGVQNENQKTKRSPNEYTTQKDNVIGYKPSFQLEEGPSPGVWSDIWFVNLARNALATFTTDLLTHALNLLILLNASAILLVSVSAVGADRFDEPKFDKSKAKKRFKTW